MYGIALKYIKILLSMTFTHAMTGNGNQAEEHFRCLVDQAPFMYRASEPDGSCTYFNQRWLVFRGRTMAEEAGYGWLEGLHPEDRQTCLEIYRSAFAARQSFDMVYRLRRADGEYRWVRDIGVPRVGADDALLGFEGSCVEIQEPRPERRSTPLTNRELQVLELVADGKSTKEVAALLNISYKTADSHRSRIMEKLDVHETASLVRYAIRQGLVRA